MAADPIWASVNTDGTFVSPKVQAAIDARAKAIVRAELDRLGDITVSPSPGLTVDETMPGVLALTPTGGATVTESTPGILTIGV